MAPRGALHVIQTSLVVGVQFDDVNFRLFLGEYLRDLRSRYPEVAQDYSVSAVLDELIPRFEPDGITGIAGGRYQVLRDFARRVHRLDLSMTASDFGPFEQRKSPYNFDRSYYHLGCEAVRSQLKMEFPGYNPYRSTRQWSIDFVRQNFDQVLEVLPDYLWWSMHDRRDEVLEALSESALKETEQRIASAGYNVDSFGVYLTTLETLHMEGEEIPG